MSDAATAPTAAATFDLDALADAPRIVNGEIRGVSPIDLHELQPVPVTPVAQIAAVVETARKAQPEWERLGFAERARLMKQMGKRMLERRAEILEIMREEAGKLGIEGLMSEALGPLDFVKGWIKLAKPVLTKREKLGIPKLAFPGKSAYIERVPRGVVGIITPWNYPLGVFFKPVMPALLSGNAVVVKPSEYTPRAGAWFVEQAQAVLPAGVIQLVQGGGEQGAELIEHVDAATFTGSVATGKKIGARCGERLIPVSLELGGKDAAIVLEDAEVTRTAAGITNWALHNVGQNCGAIERLYVLDAKADEFVALLKDAWSRLRVGPDGPGKPLTACDVSPLCNAMQLRIVEEHIADALEKGATLLTGGTREGMQGLAYPPTLLDHCTHEMRIMKEETFGPVLPIVRVADVDEAVRLANDSSYGLNASVWSGDITRGEAVAKRLEAGTVYVNNHAISGALAPCPWTGVKDSGPGVANSKYALETFTRLRTVFRDKNKKPDPFWYPYDEDLQKMGESIAEIQLGKLGKALGAAKALSRPKAITAFFRRKDS